MSIYIAIKIQKSTERPIFLTIFFAEKQFFEKIISRGGRQLIVLNPFLDSLGHFGLKNISLPPGTGLGCFQSSQDVVYYGVSILYVLNSKYKVAHRQFPDIRQLPNVSTTYIAILIYLYCCR